MSEVPYNPDDPIFLLSRSLDEELSGAEREKLDRALASSGALRAEADRLRRLNELIQRWGERPVQVDWVNHAAHTKARLIDDGQAEKLEKVDQLLGRWASQTVSIDEEAFTAAVMASVRAERKTPSWHSVVFRLGVPLAAAAAVVFAVVGTSWFTPESSAKPTIVLGHSFADNVDLPGPVIEFGQGDDSETLIADSNCLLGGAAYLRDDGPLV